MTMLEIWVLGVLVSVVCGGTTLLIGSAPYPASPGARRWGARVVVLSCVWPVLVPVIVFGLLGALSRAGGWLLKEAELPTPRVLKAKVYDADAGALSAVDAQGGEFAVLPPPSRGEP